MSIKIENCREATMDDVIELLAKNPGMFYENLDGSKKRACLFRRGRFGGELIPVDIDSVDEYGITSNFIKLCHLETLYTQTDEYLKEVAK